MMNDKIEAKALEEFPETTGYPLDPCTDRERAAFIKGCQYAATPSGVNREDAEKWIEARYPKGEDEHIAQLINGAGRKGGMAMYGYLASLYPAQPGYSEARPIETAPKDGTEILGWCDLGEDGFQWRPVSWPTHDPRSQAGKEGRTGPWQYVQDNSCRYPTVTHWMPLPSPPLNPHP